MDWELGFPSSYIAQEHFTELNFHFISEVGTYLYLECLLPYRNGSAKNFICEAMANETNFTNYI